MTSKRDLIRRVDKLSDPQIKTLSLSTIMSIKESTDMGDGVRRVDTLRSNIRGWSEGDLYRTPF